MFYLTFPLVPFLVLKCINSHINIYVYTFLPVKGIKRYFPCIIREVIIGRRWRERKEGDKKSKGENEKNIKQKKTEERISKYGKNKKDGRKS